MFSSYGQKWGNPIYDWKAMEKLILHGGRREWLRQPDFMM